MTPSTGKQYDPLEELDALETPRATAKSVADAKKTTEKTAEKKPANSGGSWFGGLFSKLAPKPKNQMILPDDNNPSVRICHCAMFSFSLIKRLRRAILCFMSLRACADTFGNRTLTVTTMLIRRTIKASIMPGLVE